MQFEHRDQLIEKYKLAKLKKNLVPAKDILEREYKEEDLYVVENLIAKNTSNLILGHWGCGKTWFALLLAKAIALDNNLGEFKVYQNSNVLYINNEETEISLNKKLKLLNYPPTDKILFLHNWVVDSKDDLIKISDVATERNIKVIFVDTLRKFATYNENSSKETSDFFRQIKEILLDNGITLIFLHHRGKGSGMEIKEDTPQSVLGRGSSEIMASGGVILMIKKNQFKENLSIIVEQDKNRSGKEIGGFQVDFAFPDVFISSYSATESKKQRLIDYVNKRIQNDGEVERFEVMEFAKSIGLSIYTAQDYMDDAVKNDVFSKIKRGRRIAYTFGTEMEINNEVGN
jgi:energy-coupling factor transporter ATP-binding protein EcfA2